MPAKKPPGTAGAAGARSTATRSAAPPTAPAAKIPAAKVPATAGRQAKGLDAIDRRLLAILQEDGRITAEALAARVGLTASPCLRRIRLLEEAGIIRRYVAIVDQKEVGLPVSVFVSVKLERQREEELDRFAAAVVRWPEVVECYLMTGPRDYLLRVVVPDLEAYEAFLKAKLTRLEGVASIESSFALGQLKYTSVLPIP